MLRAATTPPVPVVEVVRVDRENLSKEITVPAEFRPYTEVELHAKVSGYVKEMKVDIGDRVKAGQLIAVLEVPELHDDFDHAVANERRAQAGYRDAHLAYTRLVAVNTDHPNLVAQQDLDTAEAHDATAQGGLEEAKADVEKYQTMVSYTRIVAPFDGVITKRYADPGSLIQAGTTSNTQAMPLVRISNNMLLRLDFPVSVDYVHGIRLDTPLQRARRITRRPRANGEDRPLFRQGRRQHAHHDRGDGGSQPLARGRTRHVRQRRAQGR